MHVLKRIIIPFFINVWKILKFGVQKSHIRQILPDYIIIKSNLIKLWPKVSSHDWNLQQYWGSSLTETVYNSDIKFY